MWIGQEAAARATNGRTELESDGRLLETSIHDNVHDRAKRDVTDVATNPSKPWSLEIAAPYPYSS